MYLSAPRWWGYPTTLAGIARNWTQDQDGAQRRMGNSVGAFRQLADRANHLAAFSGRVSFGQHLREADIEPYGSANPVLFATQDYVIPPNGQTVVVRALTLPRIYDSGGDAVMRVVLGLIAGGYTEDSSMANAGSAAPRWPEDLGFSQVEIDRIDTTPPAPRFIQTFGGYTIVDLVIQDKSQPTLDTDRHAAVRGGLGSGGRTAIADLPEELRYAFDRLRSGNLPVMFQWSARGTPDGWADETTLPAGGDCRGIWITSDTFVNAFDSSVTSRTATSPGFYCPACYTGLGSEIKAAGQSIGVKVSVLAKHNGSGVSTVRIQGPDHIASNYVDVEIAVAASADWYTSASLLSLNTMAQDADVSTARNKVDPLAKVGTAGDDLIIYAIKGEMYIV